MSFDPLPARRGLDALLALYPHFDVIKVELQLPAVLYSETIPQRRWEQGIAGPWLLVTLGQPSEGENEAYARWEFAIWKRTGAVYRVGLDGAVPDDPIITV